MYNTMDISRFINYGVFHKIYLPEYNTMSAVINVIDKYRKSNTHFPPYQFSDFDVAFIPKATELSPPFNANGNEHWVARMGFDFLLRISNINFAEKSVVGSNPSPAKCLEFLSSYLFAEEVLFFKSFNPKSTLIRDDIRREILRDVAAAMYMDVYVRKDVPEQTKYLAVFCYCVCMGFPCILFEIIVNEIKKAFQKDPKNNMFLQRSNPANALCRAATSRKDITMRKQYLSRTLEMVPVENVRPKQTTNQ
jgi:hypothetical protein